MSNDTSDEAYRVWYASTRDKYGGVTPEEAWEEAVRRCEAQMEERERKAFQTAWNVAHHPTASFDDAWQAFKSSSV